MGCTAAQLMSVMETFNPIGTIAAPVEVELANLQAITIDDRTRAILMSSKLHYTENYL